MAFLQTCTHSPTHRRTTRFHRTKTEYFRGHRQQSQLTTWGVTISLVCRREREKDHHTHVAPTQLFSTSLLLLLPLASFPTFRLHHLLAVTPCPQPVSAQTSFFLSSFAMTLPDGTQEMPTDLQRQLAEWTIPPDSHLQRMHYTDRAARIFLELMHRYQDLIDESEQLYAGRPDDAPDPYDASIHGALYTIQLVTMALQTNHYRAAALTMEVTQNCHTLDDAPLMLEATKQLQDLYRHIDRQSIFDIAKWLFQQHGFHLWIHDQEVAFISLYLQEPLPGGVGMPPFD